MVLLCGATDCGANAMYLKVLSLRGDGDTHRLYAFDATRNTCTDCTVYAFDEPHEIPAPTDEPHSTTVDMDRVNVTFTAARTTASVVHL